MKKHHTFPIDMLTKFAQTVFFVFSFFVLSAQTDQRYYWVGGGTNNEWGTIENWSNVSGGMPAAGITTAPTNVNTVIFDQNSFLDEDSSIVINGAVQCDSLLCLNSLHLPYFAASSGASLTINGSMLLRQFMTMALTLNFNSNRPNETIRSNGVTIGYWNSIRFNGTATYTLLDSTRFSYSVDINSGILNTNGNYVSSEIINILNTGSIHFANSIIEITGTSYYCWNNSSSNFITAANSNGSLIRFTDFYNPTGLKLYANTADIYNNIEIASGQIYYGTYNKITFLGSGSIFNNVTIDTLIINDISTFTLDNSTTINEFLQGKLSTPCGGQWALNGSGSGQVTLGNNAIVDIERALIKDLGFSASVTAANSVDLGNNSNIIFTAPAVKKTLYWIGETGNWNDAMKWSLTSGGLPANCVPTVFDNVIFDNNSFSAPNQTVTVDLTAYCDSMLWIGTNNFNPQFVGGSTVTTEIYGSLVLQTGMQFVNTINFNSNRPNETIRSNGATIGYWNSIRFNGTATYTLLDSTRFSYSVDINSGILNTNGNYVSSEIINILNTGSIHFANSIIEITGTSYYCWNNSSSNLITAANSNGSLIRFTDFYSPTNPMLYANSADIYNNIEIASGQIYRGTYNKITFLGSGGIFYSVTIDTLIINDISTFTLDNSSTINEFLQGKLSTPCGGQWALNGSGSGQVTLGNNAIVDIERALIKDLGFSASVTAANSVDLGNNSNIIFTAPAVKKTLYWIGETGNWNDAMKWSLTSGGVPANCVPTVFDNVIFDNNSFSAPNQTVTVDLTAFCDSMSWIGTNNFNPQFVGGSTVTTEIYGSLVLQTGMQFVNTINFNSNRPNETIRSNGATIGYWNSIRFNGTATYTLLDSTRFSYSVDINSGILNTNGNYVSSEIINILNTGSIHFANSIIEITGTSYYCWNNSSSNLITAANSNGSLIRFTDFYSPTNPMLYANSADIYNNIEIASGLIYRGTYNKITFLGSGGIFYNVTTDTLVLTAPANMIYTFSDTVRVKEGAYLSGTPCVQIYLQSNSETTPAIFDIKSQAANFSDDTLLIDHVYLHGIQALQGSDNAKLKKGSHSPDINQSGANWGYGIGTNNYNSGFAAMLPYNSGGSTYFGDDRVVPCGSFPHTLYSDNFLPSYGATFEWRRDSLTTPIIAETPDYAVTDSGTYYLTVNYGNGCQATDDVEFTVLSIDSISETICYGTTYSGWNLTDLDTEGFYTSRYKNAAGCDSLVYLTLSIRPSVDTTSLSATICRGDTLHYNGYALFDPNFQFSTFSFQLANVYGCDSMIKFNLSYHPYIDTTHITAEICQGSTYVLNGFNVSAEGVHLLTVQNSNGCDSTLKLTLSFTNLLKDTITAAICQGEQYTLNGFNENTAGAYNLMSQAADGCDSLTTLILTVKSHSLFAIDTAICKRETVQFFGQNLTEEGTYSHTLTNAAGCDSTVSITITHKPALYTQLDTAICASETVSFFGRQLTETGVYSETRDSYRGCDSTIELTLTVWAIPNISFEAIPAVVALRAGGEIFFLNHTDSAFLNNPDYRFTWNFGDDSAEENLIFSPTHTYSDWGDFIVTFSIDHSLNCHAEASITVTVEEMLEFPNIITPNGDGKNDVFAIINLNTAIDANDPNHYRENLLTIYNRWGKKVYEAKNYDTFMKGEELLTGTKSFSGQNCPDGTYYFTFYYKGKLEIYHLNGTLMIVRRVINN